VLLDGQKVFRRTPESMARQGVAHVPEGRGTFSTFSVLDNLRLGAWVQRGFSDRDLAHVFEFFPRLYERRDQQAGTLSGGEQQMLALARAMMAKPRVLLLDEPSLGLAPLVVREIFKTLRRMNESGTTIVVVEQNATIALTSARTAHVLETGRVVLSGLAKDLQRDESVRRSYLGY
jgi:branched-chain amino acid transport system ATP-binding protein